MSVSCACIYGHECGFYQPIFEHLVYFIFLDMLCVVNCAIETLFYDLPTENERKHMQAHELTQQHKYNYVRQVYASKELPTSNSCELASCNER